MFFIVRFFYARKFGLICMQHRQSGFDNACTRPVTLLHQNDHLSSNLNYRQVSSKELPQGFFVVC